MGRGRRRRRRLRGGDHRRADAAARCPSRSSRCSTTGQLATVGQLTLSVTNQHRARVRPALHARGRHGHDRVLAPRGRARRARRRTSSASYTHRGAELLRRCRPSSSGFQVLASRQDPASVSRTCAYVASLWRVVLQPAAINAPVPVGQQHHRPRGDRQPARPARAAAGAAGLPRAGHLRAAGAAVQPGLHQQQPGGPDARRGQHRTATASRPSGSARPVGGSNPVYFEANLVKPGLGLSLRLLADPDSEVRLMSAGRHRRSHAAPRPPGRRLPARSRPPSRWPRPPGSATPCSACSWPASRLERDAVPAGTR